MYCQCCNLNYRTVERKYRGKQLVASKWYYCHIVNCGTIKVSDCEIRMYVIRPSMGCVSIECDNYIEVVHFMHLHIYLKKMHS